jgi:hypothetical protein
MQLQLLIILQISRIKYKMQDFCLKLQKMSNKNLMINFNKLKNK